MLVTEWRQRWQDLQNERLAENGSDARVDCRTNEAQGKGEPDIHYGHEVIGLERRTGEKSQVRLAHEAEVAERQEADQVIDNEIAVERDGVLELKAMLEAAEQERVDQERLALSGSAGDAEVLKWWADRVDERAVEIRNEDRAADNQTDEEPDDDGRLGLAVEVQARQAGADDAAVKQAEAALTADCPELAARVVQAQDRQRIREHKQKRPGRSERAVEIRNEDRAADNQTGPDNQAAEEPDDDGRLGLAVEVQARQAGADDAAVKQAEAASGSTSKRGRGGVTADCPELAAQVVQAQNLKRVQEHQKKNLERRKRVAKIKERDRLLASGPEGDAEVITWATERERAEVAERMVKARIAGEPVIKAQSENSRSLQAKDREKPEQPRGWFAFLKQRRYKRELAVWETERSEIVAEGRALEKKRDQLLRVERNVGGYTVRQVRKDMAAVDLLMSDRIKKAKKRQIERERKSRRSARSNATGSRRNTRTLIEAGGRVRERVGRHKVLTYGARTSRSKPSRTRKQGRARVSSMTPSTDTRSGCSVCTSRPECKYT